MSGLVAGLSPVVVCVDKYAVRVTPMTSSTIVRG